MTTALMIALGINVFLKGGGSKMIGDWWDNLTTKEKKDIEKTRLVIEKDIEKAQFISRIKKYGDGYEIIQNSINF